MRRIPGPGGLLILAALAAPLIVKGAKPLVKAAGRGIKKFGEKMVQAVDEVEAEVKVKFAEAQAAHSTADNEAASSDAAGEPMEESVMDSMNAAANDVPESAPPKPSKPAAQRKPAEPKKPAKRPAKAAEDETAAKAPQGRKKPNPNLKTG